MHILPYKECNGKLKELTPRIEGTEYRVSFNSAMIQCTSLLLELISLIKKVKRFTHTSS